MDLAASQCSRSLRDFLDSRVALHESSGELARRAHARIVPPPMSCSLSNVKFAVNLVIEASGRRFLSCLSYTKTRDARFHRALVLTYYNVQNLVRTQSVMDSPSLSAPLCHKTLRRWRIRIAAFDVQLLEPPSTGDGESPAY